MSKSRGISKPVRCGTIRVDASYAEELVEFWTQKYEQVKEELDQIKDSSVVPSSSPRSSSCDRDEERERGPSSATEYEEGPGADALRACNEDLKDQLAASEKRRLELSQQIQAFFTQNAALALEADISRQQKIGSIYLPVAFFPAGETPPILRFSSPKVLSEGLPADLSGDHPIRFIPRPPACLPLRVPACGRHGYWFAPEITHPEAVEFELVVEGKPDEWTYLGRYKSVHLPGGDMKLSEWLILDDDTKRVHCVRVATQKLGQDAVTPAAVSAAVTELKEQYESGHATIPCFTLVCTGFTAQVHTALQSAATRTRKRKANGQVQGKRIKREK